MKKIKISHSPLFYLQIGTVIFCASIIVAAILYVTYQNIQLKQQLNEAKSGNLNQANQELTSEIADLLKQMSIVLELPQDESPTVATILDVESLKNNAFFLNAQNGDKVIVYKNAGKAYLYRPETKKVIETGSFSSDSLPIEGNALTPQNADILPLPSPSISLKQINPSPATQSSSLPDSVQP